MLGPQGTGHAQNFAKGDSPLAVSGAARSRFQPEGHENISRPRADHEIRVSDFESTASGGSDALFPASREQELLSGESCQNPCQLLKQVFQRLVIPRGATHLPGIFSRHHLVIRRERTETRPEMLVCTWISTKKLMNRTKNTLCQVLKGVGRPCQPLHASTQRCGEW